MRVALKPADLLLQFLALGAFAVMKTALEKLRLIMVVARDHDRIMAFLAFAFLELLSAQCKPPTRLLAMGYSPYMQVEATEFVRLHTNCRAGRKTYGARRTFCCNFFAWKKNDFSAAFLS
jgi:hypothetical protein